MPTLTFTGDTTALLIKNEEMVRQAVIIIQNILHANCLFLMFTIS